MKLEGSLDAFGLPDVLQLLHATHKTGALTITQGGSPATLHLVDGEVASACLSSDRLHLLRRLVAHGLVDEAAVGQAAEAAAESGDGLVSTLVSQGLVGEDVARHHADLLALDTVFELLRWTSGDFAFSAEEVSADDVGLRIPAQDVVQRALARSAQWERASAVVASPAAIPVPASVLDRDDVTLTSAQWALLRLMDGGRTVAEISELTGNGEYGTVVDLAELIDQGLVRLASDLEAVVEPDLASRLAILAMLDDAEALNMGEEPQRTAGAAHDPGTVVHVADPGPSPLPSAPLEQELARDAGQATSGSRSLLGGAHVPTNVVPPRPEPFLPQRRPDHAEVVDLARESGDSVVLVPGVVGANAVVTVNHADPLPERAPSDVDDSVLPTMADDDPLLNRSLVLRLIAGVRGL